MVVIEEKIEPTAQGTNIEKDINHDL
jgi:hypothetical protein